jgi:transposase
VSADAAEWIGAVALDACENATLCLDPFHIFRWASDALDRAPDLISRPRDPSIVVR